MEEEEEELTHPLSPPQEAVAEEEEEEEEEDGYTEEEEEEDNLLGGEFLQESPEFDFLGAFRQTLHQLKLDKGESGEKGQCSSWQAEQLQQLEEVFQCVEQREHDFRTAAEIGQMLVEKNQQLMLEVERLDSEWEQKLREQQESTEDLLDSLEELEAENQQLKALFAEAEDTADELRLKVELLQNEKQMAAETQMNYSESVDELKERIRALKLEAKVNSAYKEKTRQLLKEVESLKKDIEEERKVSTNLAKQKAALHKDLVVLKETASTDQMLEEKVKLLEEELKSAKALKQTNQILLAKVKQIKKEKEELDNLMKENENLTEAVNSLMKANKHFRQQQEEDKALLEEANNKIKDLLRTLEEQRAYQGERLPLAQSVSLFEELEKRVTSMLTLASAKPIAADKGEGGPSSGDSHEALRIILDAEVQRRVEAILAAHQKKDTVRNGSIDESRVFPEQESATGVAPSADSYHQKHDHNQNTPNPPPTYAVRSGSSRSWKRRSVVMEPAASLTREERKRRWDIRRQSLQVPLPQPFATSVLSGNGIGNQAVPTSSALTPSSLSSNNKRSRVSRTVFRPSFEEKSKLLDQQPCSPQSPELVATQYEEPNVKPQPRQINQTIPLSGTNSEILQGESYIKNEDTVQGTSSDVPKRTRSISVPPQLAGTEDSKQHQPKQAPAPRNITAITATPSPVLIFQRIAKIENLDISSPDLLRRDTPSNRNDAHPRRTRHLSMLFQGPPNAHLFQTSKALPSSPLSSAQRFSESSAEDHPTSSSSALPDSAPTTPQTYPCVAGPSSSAFGLSPPSSSRSPSPPLSSFTPLHPSPPQRHYPPLLELHDPRQDETKKKQLQILSSAFLLECYLHKLELLCMHGADSEFHHQASAFNQAIMEGQRQPQRQSFLQVVSSHTAQHVELCLGLAHATFEGEPLTEIVNEVDLLHPLCTPLGMENALQASPNNPSVVIQTWSTTNQHLMTMLLPQLSLHVEPPATLQVVRNQSLLVENEYQEEPKIEQDDEKGQESEKERREEPKPGQREKDEQKTLEQKANKEGKEKDVIKIPLQDRNREATQEQLLRHWEQEEKKHIKLITKLREKLNDANLAIMNKTMQSVLSFSELVQLSNALINSILKEAKRLFKLPGLRNPSLVCLSIDLLMEVGLLMLRCNDFSEAINQPTLDKLAAFQQRFAQDDKEQKMDSKQTEGRSKLSLFISSVFGNK